MQSQHRRMRRAPLCVAIVVCALLAPSIARGGRFRTFRRPLAPPEETRECEPTREGCDEANKSLVTASENAERPLKDELTFGVAYEVEVDGLSSGVELASEYKFGRFWNATVQGAIEREGFDQGGSTESELAAGVAPPWGQLPDTLEWRVSVLGKLASSASGAGGEAILQWTHGRFSAELVAQATFGQATTFKAQLSASLDIGDFQLGAGLEHEDIAGDMEDGETTAELQLTYGRAGWTVGALGKSTVDAPAFVLGAILERSFEVKLAPRSLRPRRAM